jgi:hypothetical protein
MHPMPHPRMKFLNVLIKTGSHDFLLVGLVLPTVRKYRFNVTITNLLSNLIRSQLQKCIEIESFVIAV